MTANSIFYFVNAEGSGHTRRAEAILQFLNVPVVIASERPELVKHLRQGDDVCHLPRLRLDRDRQLADDVLHIPYGEHRAYLERMKSVVDHCQRHHCSLAIIDVCAETAMVMRLCGIPYLYMRMSGKRNDAAHLQAYRAADGLIASYPQAFEEDWVPGWIRQKTCYVGGILSTKSSPGGGESISQKPYILVMRGGGSSQLTPDAIASAASLVPDYRWIGIGFNQPQMGQNFEILPRVADPTPYLQQAATVITNTGNNSVLEVGLQAKPLITYPEWRFFDEQVAKAEQLTKRNLATSLSKWPQTSDAWLEMLKQAAGLDTQAWSTILSADGAKQAAGYVTQQFDRVSEPFAAPTALRSSSVVDAIATPDYAR
ncbi:MAG: hypothetical protein WBA10_05825 [Elainellaceae cyanobacterium]